MQMPRSLLLHVKNVRNFEVKLKLKTKPRSLKPCHVCIAMIVHIKSIMRPEVFIISTFAVLALLMRADLVLTVLSNVGRRIQKRINLGISFGNKGPAQDKFATSPSSYAYGSRIINCKNKGTVSQYGASFHVWKQWLSMSNMCRPVDPRHSFAEVLKTRPSKYENTSSLMTTTCKSKVSTLSKAQVQQVLNKATLSEKVKSPCVHKSVYRAHTVDPVPCYNRFDP